MEKFQLEYTFKASPSVLYSRFSTASGLSEWFADNVTVKGKIYTFFWDESSQEAEMLQKKQNEFVTFRWLENDEETFFEFRIAKDELTSDVSVIITDFADDGETDDSIDLWDSQINELKQLVGA